MFTFLSNFFKTHRTSYSYLRNFEEVKNHIEKVLVDDFSLWSKKDIKGKFINNETFDLRLVSVAYSMNLSFQSKLIGKIQGTSDSTSKIDVEIRSHLLQFFLFFIFLISGLTIFTSGLITSNLKEIITGVAFSIIGPSLCAWFGNILNLTLKNRYLINIHQPLLT